MNFTYRKLSNFNTQNEWNTKRFNIIMNYQETSGSTVKRPQQ